MLTPPTGAKRTATGRLAVRILAPSLVIFAGLLLMSALAEAQPRGSLIDSASTASGASAANGATSTPSPGCGLQWNVVQAPDPGPGNTNFLQAVAAVSPFELWAVGNHYPGSFSRPLMEHFDGYNWAIEPSPSLSVGDHFLEAVSGASPDDVWALGYNDGAARADPMPLQVL